MGTGRPPSSRFVPKTLRSSRGGSVIRILPIILLLATACSTEAVEDTTTTTLADTTTTTDAPATTTTTAAAEVTTTTSQPVDAAAVVAESLTTSSANYRFTSVILVDGETLTEVSGIVDGTSVSATVKVGTSEVSYVRTAEGEWVTGADGEWVALVDEPPVASPLASLGDVSGLTLDSGDANSGVYTGVLGTLAGQAQGVAFTLTIEDGFITEIRYQADTGGQMAEVITTLSDFGSAGTISPPESVG